MKFLKSLIFWAPIFIFSIAMIYALNWEEHIPIHVSDHKLLGCMLILGYGYLISRWLNFTEIDNFS